MFRKRDFNQINFSYLVTYNSKSNFARNLKFSLNINSIFIQIRSFKKIIRRIITLRLKRYRTLEIFRFINYFDTPFEHIINNLKYIKPNGIYFNTKKIHKAIHMIVLKEK